MIILTKLILVMLEMSALKAAPLKIGYNDPGSCDTQGTSIDYGQDTTLVSGITKS